MSSKTDSQIHYRTCAFCEAMCGVKIEHDGEKVISIKGDEHDPFSQGYICPKATALQDLYEDPDRLRAPVERTENGWKEISWDDALDKVAEGITRVQQVHGDNALGIYLGNPNIHNMGNVLTAKHLLAALKSRNRFSATSIDQLPHHIVCMHLFGHMLRIPIPDVNRTKHMIIIGGNPLASNGSIMTVANMRQKLKDIKARGGKVVVIDPRRTETAEAASEHHFIRPGTDVMLLLAMLKEVYDQGLTRNTTSTALLEEADRIPELVRDITTEQASAVTGIPSEDIRRLAYEFANAETAVCYGRMGVSVQEFGLLCQYLIMLLNIVTGRLDTEGGLLFPEAALDIVSNTGPGYLGKRRTRISNLPDFNGDFPVAAMAEEMLTEGPGQIRSFINVAGNPVLSTPNSEQLDKALSGMDFMVSVDFYINETSRHANIILPPVSPLERPHYDTTFNNFAVHNVAKYSPPLFKKKATGKYDWQISLGLAKRMDSKASFATRIERKLIEWFGPEFLLSQGLKRGPYGHVTLKNLKKQPHGIDLGPLKPTLPEALRHKHKRIPLNIDFYKEDLPRVSSAFQDYNHDQILLIGRRHVRSNNSWLHNSYRLVKGKSRCTLMLHPDTAEKHNISHGELVTVSSRVGSVQAEAEITDELAPGVVSLPHGWGHGRKGVRQSIAQKHAGVNLNDLTDERMIDELSGNAAVNGVPVTLSK